MALTVAAATDRRVINRPRAGRLRRPSAAVNRACRTHLPHFVLETLFLGSSAGATNCAFSSFEQTLKTPFSFPPLRPTT